MLNVLTDFIQDNFALVQIFFLFSSTIIAGEVLGTDKYFNSPFADKEIHI
jgi:hypothetical protein